MKWRLSFRVFPVIFFFAAQEQPCRLSFLNRPFIFFLGATMMSATVNLNRLATHKPHLKAGGGCGRVTGIKMYKGWCYVSCSQCAKKLQRTVASFTFLSCNNINTVDTVWRCPSQMKPVKLCLFVSIGLVMVSTQTWKVRPTVPGEDELIQFHSESSDFTISLILSEREHGGDDDNGEDNSGAISVAAKVKAGGSSQAEGASDKVKKARKA
ncbi:hypothetical protein F2Q69_00033842 [Brassica cretica]|uniref:Uncharacterized protein n=1 Tax=Brassica cretica TaxID=69181 RepID=A0A8S9SCS0_BRACR|nr:hypothetical protein F2Q69_00033842 [Brassica cretica]